MNQLKHNVSKEEAEQVFYNDPQIIASDKVHSNTEERFSILGHADTGRFLSIIFTKRGSKLRVISARDQSKKEKAIYVKLQPDKH